VQGLLSGLSARIQPLDVPAAFSSMQALETAAADSASVDAGGPSPACTPQPQRSPLDRMFEHVSKGTSGKPLEPLLATPRPARTERERQDLESRAAKVAAGVTPSSSDTSAEAAAIILRLFDTDKDGTVSREELLSQVPQARAKATPEAFDEPPAAKVHSGGRGPT
jgi:hypothetical protein